MKNLSYQSSTHKYRSHPHAYYDPIMTLARIKTKVFQAKFKRNREK